jgi:hypothetical protein
LILSQLIALDLQQHGVPSRLYEGEHLATARAHQGGAVNVEPKSGDVAIIDAVSRP